MKKRNIQYQMRDYGMLGLVGKFAVVDDSMIGEHSFAHNSTHDARSRRLRLLEGDGCIGRLSYPVVSLAERRIRFIWLNYLRGPGAQRLKEAGMAPARVLRRPPRPDMLLHWRDVARTLWNFERGARLANLAEPETILEMDRRSGVSPNASRAEKFILYEDLKTEGVEVLQLRPDASSWLRCPSSSTCEQTTWHDLLIYWEIDRSTQGLSAIAKKIPPYNHFLRNEELDGVGNLRRLYRRHWPLVERPTLRVFFVCPSLERIQSISSAIRTLPGSEFVRLATMTSLTADQVLRQPIWFDVLGNCHAIYPAVQAGAE